ncbi:VOC family protein [Microcoleus sp. Pol14C6]|uniref:VOC family protein n=1 Tax=unclassified Microcoleus TaxID=2642155 RepID=UPI002FD5504A
MNKAPIQVQKIRAIGLTVTDADRSKNFYTKALSFEPVSDITVEGQNYSYLEGVDGAKIRIVTLQLGNELIELMEYLNVEGKPIPKDSQSNDLWFQHLAIVVSDIDRAYAHLCSFPIDPISTEPQTIPPENKEAAGVRAFKFKDIDGHNLELIWFPPDKGQDKWHQKRDRSFLGIDHSAIAISNTEQSLKFYRDLLGMQVDGGSLNQGETQVRLDNLPEAKVKITALRPIQGGLGIELLDYLVTPKGRPIPRDWKSCDIAHMQVELIVNDLEQLLEKLRQNGVEFVSPGLVHFSDNSSSYRQCFLVKDPNGHAILLTSQVANYGTYNHD